MCRVIYAGRMRVAGGTGAVDSLVTRYWLQLVEITGETAEKYLQVFYQRINSKSVENVLDIRPLLQSALQKHVAEDHCDFCSQFIWSVCSKQTNLFFCLISTSRPSSCS